jgi:hypothetical protein
MENLRIEDLSVGDWVQAKMTKWDYEDLDITPSMKVVKIEKDCVRLGFSLDDLEFEVFVEDLQPIPITAEVLEKNGWSEFSDYHNSWKLDIASDKRVWMFKNSHDWTFQVMSWGLGHNHSVAKAYIKDIHELQHALRLAKVDKEIVL